MKLVGAQDAVAIFVEATEHSTSKVFFPKQLYAFCFDSVNKLAKHKFITLLLICKKGTLHEVPFQAMLFCALKNLSLATELRCSIKGWH